MRPALLVTLALVSAGLAALPAVSGSAKPEFDIRGRWAFAGKGCGEAEQFVEFDGQHVLGSGARLAPTRVAENYRATVADGRVVVTLTDVASRDPAEWRLTVDGRNTMRLNNAFFAQGDASKLTRCPARV